MITQQEDLYLYNFLNSNENQHDISTEENFAENYIDRSAVVITYKKPFVDWITEVIDGEIDEFLENEIYSPKVYLVEEVEDLEKWIKKKYKSLFDLELQEYCLNKKKWPQKRNYKMFQQWFQVSTSESVYDLEKRPVIKG